MVTCDEYIYVYYLQPSDTYMRRQNMPLLHQAITWANVDILSFGPLVTHLNVIWIDFFFKENAIKLDICKMEIILSRSYCVKRLDYWTATKLPFHEKISGKIHLRVDCRCLGECVCVDIGTLCRQSPIYGWPSARFGRMNCTIFYSMMQTRNEIQPKNWSHWEKRQKPIASKCVYIVLHSWDKINITIM